MKRSPWFPIVLLTLVFVLGSQASAAQPVWISLGPKPINCDPTGALSGRVTGLAVGPDATGVGQAVYAASASGGVWSGSPALPTNWRPSTDNLPTLSSGAIGVSFSGPFTVYVGTGDGRNSRTSFWGQGVFKSTDGGVSWAPTSPLDPARAPSNSTAIPSIAVGHSESGFALAAVAGFREANDRVDGGIYRTDDGGAMWTRPLGGNLLAGPIAGTSVAADPTDSSVFYAALGYSPGSPNNGVWKSVDGGRTFSKLGGGLPSSNAGRTLIAVAPGSPQIIYVASENASSGALLGMWRSADGGANWQAVAAAGAICPRCKQEMALAVSPLDPNIVFFGAVSLYRSTDGGQTFTKTMNSKTSGAVHSDIHALAFSEFVPGQLWVGSDGGVWSVDDSSASLPLDWQSVNGGLSISQFYGLAVHPTDPNLAYGGTQDNGVVLKYTGSQAWCALVAPGDGGSMAVDPAAPTTLYGYAAILLLERSLDGGVHWAPIRSGLDTSDRTQVYPPYEMDPRDSHVLYLGTYRLYRTSTRGDLWQVISPDLTIDPADPNSVGNLSAVGAGGPDTGVIYTGSTNGQIYVTSDLGASWTRRVSANLPRRFVSSIAVHPLDSSVAYVTYQGWNDATTGHGHVFKTTDRGATWTDISGALPDLPANHILLDPALPNLAYVATDNGVYASGDGGQSWRYLGSGLPNVPVYKLAIQQPNRLIAATQGRGVWQTRGCGASGMTDADGDGVADLCDNCPSVANSTQTDSDADGYGAGCDCDDANPAINPGHAEVVCDGRDNNCDGAVDEGQAPPVEVGSTALFDAGATLSWTPPPLAVTYNLYRGERSLTGSFSYDHVCLAPNLGGASAGDATVPPAGRIYYYLVSSKNCMGESGLGSSTSAPRPTPSPCP